MYRLKNAIPQVLPTKHSSFFLINDNVKKASSVSVSRTTFKPDIVLVRPGGYPRVENLKGASLGLAPALLALGWKDLLGTNTLTYYEHL
jgi:hypothetical protein